MVEGTGTDKVRVLPIPDILDSTKDWDIRSVLEGARGSFGVGVPSVDVEKGLMFVPLDDDNRARAIRDHEMAHIAAKSGKAPRTISPSTMYAVEDARVNQFMFNSGVTKLAEVGGVAAERATQLGEEIAKGGNLRAAAELLVALHGDGAKESFKEALGEHNPKLYAKAHHLALQTTRKLFSSKKGFPQFKKAVSAARWLDKQLGEIEKKKKETEKEKVEARSVVWTPGMGDPKETLPHEDRMVESGVEEISEKLEARRVYEKSEERSSYCRWGKMEIQEPECTIPLLNHLQRRGGHKATEDGILIGQAYRRLTDGKVFYNRKWVPGGTVVVDTSGSMHLDEGDILKTVETAPGITIAVYGGSGSRGVLRIVARNGRRVDKSDLRLGMAQNVIDGPAVEWLTTQRGPRIWVCDGGVTGVHDGPVRLSDLEDLEKMIIRYRIIRIESASQVAEVLSKFNLKGR